MNTLNSLLQASAALHHHLCPRQILGVRMGLLAGKLLGLELPQQDKRLLALVETNGCATDGIAVASGCWVGRRTMVVYDFGKVAATFVDTLTGQAVRIAPSAASRERAKDYAPPDVESNWKVYLIGYQRMPDDLLLTARAVTLTVSLDDILGEAGRRVICEACGEEVMNRRELVREELTLCRSCAGQRYYRPCSSEDVRIIQLTRGRNSEPDAAPAPRKSG